VRPFRQSSEAPPPARSVAPGLVTRVEGVTEVDPELMGVAQQEMPVWDTLRIAEARAEYLRWMRPHFADEIVRADGLGPLP
jgi:hypothetical protein